jgi:hypothetical protein
VTHRGTPTDKINLNTQWLRLSYAKVQARGSVAWIFALIFYTQIKFYKMSHEKFQQCIDECNACAVACRHCASECLKENEVKMLARCIQLDTDCAVICEAAVALMSGGSEFADKLCNVCADVCNACAAECEKHSDMSHCKECAEACHRCAEACLAMA